MLWTELEQKEEQLNSPPGTGGELSCSPSPTIHTSQSAPTTVRIVNSASFHDDFRRAGTILQTLVADPRVGFSDPEPEIGLRIKQLRQIENAQMRYQFDLVTIDVAVGCLHAFCPPRFDGDIVKVGFVGQHV